ncbi:hypothetical protein HMPREF9336_03286 [Segniliparus rugosus ATCC BAA-974]|uniref:Uncharacterized protein n=2 Tax=Segniliparus rugosus TaxID=286804 RepID=E5XUW4_SEGRC|nr:hypothetical protein HMPREF9336_03286 [Segniliparus rugosus ATCC BAA-974]
MARLFMLKEHIWFLFSVRRTKVVVMTQVGDVSLGEKTRSVALAAVRRYDPVFADSLAVGHRVLTTAELVRVWNAVIDEVDIVLSGGEDAKSSPFFGEPALLDEVLDEMAELKRAAVAGREVTLS